MFAHVHNTTAKPSGIPKTVAVPIVVDSANDPSKTMTTTSTSLENSLRRSNFNIGDGDLGGAVNREKTRAAMKVLESNQKHPWIVKSKTGIRQKLKEMESFVKKTKQQPLRQGQPLPDLSQDPVERHRSTLPSGYSVFVPSGKSMPKSFSCPINFLETDDPYVTSLPIFFPQGEGGLHDPGRAFKVSETELVTQYLQNARQDLSRDTSFVSLAALRLETRRVNSCHNALRGFKAGDHDEEDIIHDKKMPCIQVPGSADYYAKQLSDLRAKSEALSHPQLFYTLTSTDRWEVILASCMMQDGYTVSHVDEENDREEIKSSSTDKEYFVHDNTAAADWNCPTHRNCQRQSVKEMLDRFPNEMRDGYLSRNPYTVVRAFQQRTQSLVRNVMQSAPLEIKAFHGIKEFADGSGWAHLHGVGWRKSNELVDPIFEKLHKNEAISPDENQIFSDFADSLVCASTSASDISSHFSDLTDSQCIDIATLASTLQNHGCTDKCTTEARPECSYNFPRGPSATTLLATPLRNLDKEAKEHLELQAEEIKSTVQKTLEDARTRGEPVLTDIESLLAQSLGNVEELEGNVGFRWKGGVFPNLQVPESRHSVQFWRTYLATLYDKPEEEVTIREAVYHTSLSVSTKGYCDLVSRRRVQDAWTEWFNPHCLEAMRSNMSVQLVTHTPDRVLMYMTKGHEGHDERVSDVEKALKETVGPYASYAAKVAERARNMTEISIAEAYHKIDPELHMSDTNIGAVRIDTRFPDKRGTSFVRVDQGGTELPNREGEYQKTNRIEDKHEQR